MKKRLAAAVGLVLACKGGRAPELSALAPPPLPVLAGAPGPDADRESAYRPAPAPVFGDAPPAAAVVLRLKSGTVLLGGVPWVSDGPGRAALQRAVARAPALIVPDADTFLVQAAPLLSALDDLGASVWLEHPHAPVAFHVTLKDEPAFGRWLDEPRPGKVRIIQRADGLELQTNVGKLRGLDPNGPTVPLRGGMLDVAALRVGLSKLEERFASHELCLVPSFGTELAKSAEVLSGAFAEPGKPIDSELCLVYPRPR